jgi:hypothetical protein
MYMMIYVIHKTSYTALLSHLRQIVMNFSGSDAMKKSERQEFDLVQVRMPADLGDWLRSKAKEGFRPVSREVCMRLELQRLEEQAQSNAAK